MIATVYKSTGSWYIVKNESGKVYNARIKGKFKIDGFTSTNPLAVGDVVNIENEEDYEKQLKKGDNIILAAFGGGFTWGAVYIKWAYNS